MQLKTSEISMKKLWRVTGAAAGCGLLTASLIALGAPAASANAQGCTFAQGGAAATQCITVYGSGLHVNEVDSEYDASPVSGGAADVCNRHHQITYYNADGTKGTWYANPTSCILGAVAVLTGDDQDVYPNRNFPNNKPICGRTRNSDTGEAWTPYACVTIHS